jgi:quercetin dioxygenase-like cupin family protein
MQIASIYNDLQYADRPALSVLLQNDALKEIRILMKKSQVMKEHKAPYPIVVQVVEGVVDFSVAEQTHHLIKGDMIALDPGVLHALHALEDSIIRLSLHKFEQYQ